jgi:Holliday junction resolvase RusA-like endonuclease
VTLSFVIPGAPRTKKNHGRRIQRGGRKYDIPSAAYEAWNIQAQIHLMLGRQSRPNTITTEVNCAAIFYRDALTGDAVGYYQGLADALEEAGIVSNDKLIVSWDGSRMLKDADDPRVDVTLTTV